jgi:hypothetical protein
MEINMSISVLRSLRKFPPNFFLRCPVLSGAVLSHIISCRNLTQRQRTLLEEFAKEEQGEDEKDAKTAAGASG